MYQHWFSLARALAPSETSHASTGARVSQPVGLLGRLSLRLLSRTGLHRAAPPGVRTSSPPPPGAACMEARALLHRMFDAYGRAERRNSYAGSYLQWYVPLSYLSEVLQYM